MLVAMPLTAPPIPDELHALMATVGPVWGSAVQEHVRLMVEQFSQVHVNAPKPATVTRNIAYGPDPRQILDVYQPESMTQQPAPVLVFVHGGAFVAGSKDRTEEVYSNVLWYFARHGMVGINVEFRLAPAHPYPAGTLDVAAAVAWVRANVASYGGDSQRIFLMAHSAGAAHSAHYAYDRTYQPLTGHGLSGLIVVSGRVRAEVDRDNPNASRVKAYYGEDPSVMRQGSAVEHVDATVLPTMVAMAEFENPLIDMHCVELIHKLSVARRRAPRSLWLAGHNHTSIIAHLNTADDQLGQSIRAFIRDPR